MHYSNITLQDTLSMSYMPNNFKMDGITKYLVFNEGMIATEDELFPVSSIKINTFSGEIIVFVDCPNKEQEYVKKQLKNHLNSIIYIGPKYSETSLTDSVIGYENNGKCHMMFGFNNISEIRFVTCVSGVLAVIKHDSGRRYKYADDMEYIFESYIKL